MLHIATQVSELVHGIRLLDNIGEKVASADTAHMSQHAAAKSSNILYGVIQKEASAITPVSWPEHQKVAHFVVKAAQALRKPSVQLDQLHKIAAAAHTDRALSDAMEGSSGEGLRKLAEVRTFGREYFMELLREVI